MRVIVLSDTHIPVLAPEIPKKVMDDIKTSDLVLHAGDLVEMEVLGDIEKIKPVIAVAGNMDSTAVKGLLTQKRILTLGGFKIALIHGWGPPYSVVEAIKSELKHIRNISCVVYGHTHVPESKTVNGIIYFNPGSLSDKVHAPYNSYGILEITDKITPKIVRI